VLLQHWLLCVLLQHWLLCVLLQHWLLTCSELLLGPANDVGVFPAENGVLTRVLSARSCSCVMQLLLG
jgi:hypothetical protein